MNRRNFILLPLATSLLPTTRYSKEIWEQSDDMLKIALDLQYYYPPQTTMEELKSILQIERENSKIQRTA